MKTTYSVLFAGLLLPIFIACDKGTIIPVGTIPVVPNVTSSVVGTITATTAISGGVITYEGGAAVKSRGVCWSINHSPTTAGSKTTDGTGAGDFTSAIKGLTALTIYYLRAYATNSAGTAYGSELSFQTTDDNGILFNPTLTYGSVTDIEGNVYKTIRIGTQTWMAENLKTTKYRNGDLIPNITDDVDWNFLTTGAYCWYDNDPNANRAVYGALYNWYAVSDNRGIAPAGWHVPADDEVLTLMNYLGGSAAAGGKLKETGTTHWTSPNTGGSNQSGFTALPGSFRSLNTTFYGIHDFGYWWTSTQHHVSSAVAWFMQSNDAGFQSSFYSLANGYSVRCVKD